jgi:DnaJ domain/PilZ domain
MSKIENRGRLRRPAMAGQASLLVRLSGRAGAEVSAKVVDISESGIGLEINGLVHRGELVEIDGEVKTADGRNLPYRVARVRWCSPVGNGGYRAGLSFEQAAGDRGASNADFADAQEDHYELLQLSPNADPETIQRVFRILAQRYHPDNQETGNVDLFRKVKQSYDVLIDPDKRAAYDVQRNAGRKDRLKIFSGWESCSGMNAEQRKRQGILSLLYAQRACNPQHPSMSIRELEDMLACPREHLEFSLWFLKERKYIARSDNNRHSITCEGVEAAEQEASERAAAEREQLMVPDHRLPRLAPPA